MKILVTGIHGQLGHDVLLAGKKRGFEMIGTDVDTMDITDVHQVDETIRKYKPDAIVHCAAYTSVDAAEDNEELCRRINAVGTENIAKICKDNDIAMMYFSTDYVFDGEGSEPWREEDEKAPLNVYGETKYEGELAVQKYLDKYFILRISWVFGINGNNFIKTMLRLGMENGKVRVVDDQFGSPTYTKDLAKLVIQMITSDKYGVYHVTNEGICSWYGFACEIFRQAGLEVTVTPVDSSQFLAKAKRPINSRMSKKKLEDAGFELLPLWQDALKIYLKEIAEK